jgi:hypothetical protein
MPHHQRIAGMRLKEFRVQPSGCPGREKPKLKLEL